MKSLIQKLISTGILATAMLMSSTGSARADEGYLVLNLLAATVLHKQYEVDADPETKLVPLPAMEVRLHNRAVLNASGSPQVDYNDYHNNAVLFFQLKVNPS